MPSKLSSQITFDEVGRRECEYCGEDRPVYNVLGLKRLICDCEGYVGAADQSARDYAESVRQGEIAAARARTEEWLRDTWPRLGWGARHQGASACRRLIAAQRPARVDENNTKAWLSAHRVAWSLINDGDHLTCWIRGKPGTGKTALASAIAHDFMKYLKYHVAIKAEVGAITTMDLNDKAHAAKIRALQECDLLVLDDFRMGKSNHSDEILWSIINERNETEKSTIFTSLGDAQWGVSGCKNQDRTSSILSRILGGVRADAGNRIIHLTNRSFR